MLEELSAVSVMETSQGTIYPLLSRLRREELVDTRLRESPNGPPRRYYSLTDTGHAALDAFATYWPRFRKAVNQFLTEPPEATRESP